MKTCSDCEHVVQWEDFGRLRVDCGNPEAWDFVYKCVMDLLQEPAQAGCPHFEEAQMPNEEPSE